MDFFDTVRNRHSVRRYQSRELEAEKLDAILQAANSAPSAGDLQAYKIVLVRSADTKRALARAAFGQDFIAQSPVCLVFCADHLMSASKYGRRGTELYAVQDATIAAAYCQLAATALGLATVWVGAFDPRAAAAAVGAPDAVTPVAIIPVGYAAETPQTTPRERLEDLLHEERF